MKFRDFEMRALPAGDLYDAELVKWENNSCFVICLFSLDKDEDWKMTPCGLRLLDYWEDGLGDYIKASLYLMDICNDSRENRSTVMSRW